MISSYFNVQGKSNQKVIGEYKTENLLGAKNDQILNSAFSTQRIFKRNFRTRNDKSTIIPAVKPEKLLISSKIKLLKQDNDRDDSNKKGRNHSNENQKSNGAKETKE